MRLENEKHDEEEEAFLPPSRGYEDAPLPRKARSRPFTWYFRVLVEIAMAVAIALLVIRPLPTAGNKPSPLPKCTYLSRPEEIQQRLLTEL
jgi:hypothetical protein